jgi:TRAP-type C4-dicarboxylate transport system permease small subunit
MTEAGAAPRGPVAFLARLLMLAGGAMLIATAALTTFSVLQRWLLGRPVNGDFELVQIGSGLAVFGFLAYGTLSRSNIVVDTFTNWLPARLRGTIDGFWNLAWGVIAAALAERMLVGAMDTYASDTRTMVLSMPTWWAVALGALAFAATALAALYWALRQMRGDAA